MLPRAGAGRLLALVTILVVAASAPAGVENLRITEVDAASDLVEVTNYGTDTFTTTTFHPFCHRLDYGSGIPAGTTFGPGASLVFDVPGLDDGDSDLWLYRDSSFDDAASIVSGLKWGPQAGVGRTALAVTAGLWPSTGAFVPAPGVGETLRLARLDPTDSDHWEAAAGQMGVFFGSGEALDDPLPDLVPKGNVTIELATVVEGLPAPLGLAVPDDGSDRFWVYDQSGVVVLVENGERRPGFALDVRGRLVSLGVFGPGSFDERGLLGFAAHPGFATSPRVYTYTSEPVAGAADFTTSEAPPPGSSFDHQSVIAEWTVDPQTGIVDPASRREILRIDEPQFNHNAGTLRFGPDGHLYAAVGDGGGADDEDGTEFLGAPLFGHGPTGNGRNVDTIHGSLIRIDVDGRTSPNGQYAVPADNPFVGGPGLDEIWASGLRNPFAFSFDRQTGDLWLADVGQNDIEEIDVVERGDDLGWNGREGSFFFSPNDTGPGSVKAIPDAPPGPGTKDPVAEYDHDDGLAVIGGYVYRGTAVPELTGRYVTGDFGRFDAPTGRLFYLDADHELHELRIGEGDRPLGLWLKGFGQDRDGNLYVLGSTELGPSGTGGRVLRIVRLGDDEAPETPRVKKSSPSSFRPGERRTVTVKGKHLNGVRDVSFGEGVTVLGIQPDAKGKKILVEIEVDCDAAAGARDVAVTADGGAATGIGDARVKAAKAPSVKKLSVRRGEPGQTIPGIVLSGKRFHDCDVTVVFSDPAVTAESLAISEDGKEITFDLVVAAGAAPGKVDVTVTADGLSDTKRKAFTVLEP